MRAYIVLLNLFLTVLLCVLIKFRIFAKLKNLI